MRISSPSLTEEEVASLRAWARREGRSVRAQVAYLLRLALAMERRRIEAEAAKAEESGQ